jgi:hypothetical protein
VTFLGVDVDPTESTDKIRQYKEQQGYPWEMAPGNRDLLVSYDAFSTTRKYVVDRNGVIAFRGSGITSDSKWEELFEAVVQQ